MRKVKLRLEDYFEIDGYADLSERWNGFACPYFTFSQAQELVEKYNQSPWLGSAEYASDIDAFVFHSDQYDEPEVFGRADVVIDGEAAYAIGARCWVWNVPE